MNRPVFRLTDEEFKKMLLWSAEQDKKFCESNGMKEAYYGAIGGELTYCFTPTSIGLVIKIKHGGTKEELDLTDYETW